MKHFSEQFYKKALSVGLQAEEKNNLRERVVSYMEYHPMAESGNDIRVVSKHAWWGVSFWSPAVRVGSVLGVFVLFLVPFVAERSVPGDALYAVKVSFNEELRGTLTFDGYEKIEWETERLNRRLAEARLLASEGRLTDEVGVEVAAAVKEHTDNVKREIEVLRSEDADEAAIASISLDTTLAVQVTALQGEDGEAFATSGVDVITLALNESRASTTPEISSVPAYDKLMARVEQNTTRIYELRDALNSAVSDEEKSEIARRMSDLERSIVEATELLSTDELAARQHLVEVLQRSQRIIVFMTELEVSQSVNIAEVVPVVLSLEERTVVWEQHVETVGGLEKRLDEFLAVNTDSNLVDQASTTRASLLDLLARLGVAKDSGTDDFSTLAEQIDAIVSMETGFLGEEVNMASDVDTLVDMTATSSVQE